MIKVLPPKTAEEVVARERERKARTTLLIALLEDHLAKFHKMDDAKEIVFKRDVKGTTASSSSSNTQNVGFVSADNTSSTNDVSTAYSVSSRSISKSQKEGSPSYTDEVIHSFFANQSSAPQLDCDDLEQINDDDLEEMDLKWQDDSKALVTMDREDIDWSGHVEEDIQNFGMMAYSSNNSGSDNEKLLAEALKEKEDLKTKVKNWQNSSKNLSRLLNTQMSANDKFRLEYGDYRYGSILSYENEVLQSVFMNKECDLEDTPVNNRYVEGMHAVPPLMTGNYMPSGLDVEIDYSKFTYGPKQTSVDESDAKTSENATCESDTSVETTTSMPATVEDAPKVISKPKVWTDAPIIKEYELDSDDDLVSNVQETIEKPSFAFTDSIKNVKSPRENVKETGTPNHYPKIEKQDRHSHTRKGCSVAFGGSNGRITGKGKIKADRFSWVYFLKSKDETTLILKDYIRQVENQFNHKVKTIRSDNGTEFKNQDLIEFCGSKRIKREYSNARTLQQNGVTERKNRTLIKAARTMLADLFLPTTFWADAVNTACYVLNRVLVTKPQNKTSYELLTGFLVGYSLNSKAFRVYNLETKRVEENLHVKFLENKPNVAGKGHAWMFNLDYLTNSMNYESVSIENQANKSAGPKEANNSAGTQANDDQGVNLEEINLHDEHFVLRIWSSYSTTVKNSRDKIKKNEKPVSQVEQIFQEELEKLKRQEKEANDAVWKEASHETQDVNTNSTNLLNAVSTPVSVVGPSRALNDDEPSYPDDPSMPHLEDIFASPSEGIFTNSSYDDEGVISEALEDESWVDAMQEELLQFKIQKSAFLYGTINEEVYVTQPPGFVDPKFSNKVYKVVKALYGLHQAPRAWYATLSTFLEKSGYRRGAIDKTLFIKQDKKDIMLVQVYVKQKEDGIFISQDKYVAEILKKFDFLSVKTASTPIETQKLILPRCLFVVGLSGGGSGDGVRVVEMGWKVGVPGCLFVVGLSGRGSGGGVRVVEMGWKVGEVEYVAAAHCCGQVLWIQNQLLDYRFNLMNTKIYIDNESIICIVDNPVFHSKTMHIEIRHHFIRAMLDKGRLLEVTTARHRFLLPSIGVNTPRCDEGTLELKELMVFFVQFVLRKMELEFLLCLSVKPTSWNKFSSTMALTIICLATNQKFKFSMYILLNKNIEVGVRFYMFPRFDHQLRDMSHHQDIYDNPSLTKKVFDNIKRVGTGFSGVITPLFESMLVPAAEEVGQAQNEKLEDRVDQLEEENRALKEKSFKTTQVDTAAPVENMEKSFKQGRMIAYMDEDVEDINEEEPAEVEEVLVVVIAAKLITEVVTTAKPTATVAQVPKTSAPSRRRVVVIQDLEETTASVIMHIEVQSKDKGKGLLIEEPKPLKGQAHIDIDEAFTRPLEVELNANINWNDVVEQVKRSERQNNAVMRYQGLKRKPLTEAQARKNMMIYLKNMAEKVEEEVIVQEKEMEEGKKRQGESLEREIAKKQRMDEEEEEDICRLWLMMIMMCIQKTLWKLVKERFETTEPKNFLDDFLLNILKIMFEKPNIEASVWKDQKGRFKEEVPP
uniref:Integrase catalytic domain-containing protein n=1 Tax=Tanacetum cinerariifolium TaxID=118510 RepID=A0A6L2KNN9_TANCI|nr:hypothetical protein [Tanacetum cinerariifolium]